INFLRLSLLEDQKVFSLEIWNGPILRIHSRKEEVDQGNLRANGLFLSSGSGWNLQALAHQRQECCRSQRPFGAPVHRLDTLWLSQNVLAWLAGAAARRSRLARTDMENQADGGRHDVTTHIDDARA